MIERYSIAESNINPAVCMQLFRGALQARFDVCFRAQLLSELRSLAKITLGSSFLATQGSVAESLCDSSETVLERFSKRMKPLAVRFPDRRSTLA